MSIQFLYFLPDQTGKPSDVEIQRRGLGYALAGMRLDTIAVNNGPEGLHGLIVRVSDAATKLGFYPAEQSWQRINEHALVGWSTAHPLPGPEDLARKLTLARTEVELGDERVWNIPTTQKWITTDGTLRVVSTLSYRLKLGDDGMWFRGPIVSEHEEIARIAAEWEQVRLESAPTENADGGATQDVGRFELPVLATKVLSLNYRISEVEADILGIWNDLTIIAALDATIDLATLREHVRRESALSAAVEQ